MFATCRKPRWSLQESALFLMRFAEVYDITHGYKEIF
ncbi:unnamed protein product [Callosobruchus maculatus]|uniref:Uncharacterized protein n=1 Tax=Callosobruchus maculatus TaxID=64391 RepID=A0A653C3S2_CALMS|nr:unnamed protein product [Callosobruchus maculatus]